MIKHIVFQKFENKEDAVVAMKMLQDLQGVVPTLISMEVGLDITHSERSYDLALIATFADEAGLHAYDEHEAHQKVREFIRPRRTATASVDFVI